MMRDKGLRQQSALELLTTYSWALLIIAVFVAAVAVINSARPATNYLASSCSIEPLLPCTQTLLTYNTVSPIKFTLLFTNNLGQVMYFPVNSINITVTNIGTKGITYNVGNCTPALALQGTPVLCTAYISGTFKPPVGTQETILFSLNYQLCNGKTMASCVSTQYKSTGQSSQTMAPSSVLFHTLLIKTNPTSGTVNLNGVTYLNGANVLLLTNRYTAYAIPPSGYKFTLWGINGGSDLSSAVTPNTILNFSANGTITASFNSIAPTTTVTLTSTSSSTVSSTTSSTTSTTSTTSTSTTSTTTTSIHYVPITLTNSGSATPVNYQQLVSVNSNTYSAYINSGWGNVEFTTGAGATGTVLQAWIQTNATNTATKTIVWVKIPAGVAGGSSAIYMNFLSSNVLSSNGPTGEAPELSGTYGQYDNGGSVFALYDNFHGTTLNSSKWTTYTINNMGSAPSQVVINNELQLNHGSTWWGSDAYSTSSFATTSGWALDYQFDWASETDVGNCSHTFCDTPADVYLRYTGSSRDTTYYGEPGCPDVDVLVNIHNSVTTLSSCGSSAVSATASISPSVGVWYPASLQFIPSSGTTGNAYFYYNGAGSPTISVSIASSAYYPTTPVVAEFHDGNYASSDEFWIRDARLRVAVATPPTTSFGAVV